MASRTVLTVAGFALALASSLLPRAARADLMPMDLAACASKAAGDACEDGGTVGTCQPDKCSRLDYSNGTPPSLLEYDCIKCVPGAAPATTPPAEPTPSPTANAPATTPPAEPAPAPKAGGCTIAGDRGGLAVLLLLAIGLRRRAARSAA
jgi:hypothetical protein